MKKRHLLSILIFLASSALFGQSMTFGLQYSLAPTLYTGGNTIALMDKDYLAYNNAFNVSPDRIKAQQKNIAISFEAFWNYRITKRFGVGLDVDWNLNEGYHSNFKAQVKKGQAEDDMAYIFRPIEISPQFKIYTNEEKDGYFDFSIGPNIAFTGKKTIMDVGGTTEKIEALQNPVLYGIRAGIDGGVFIGKWLMSYNIDVTFDFNNTYKNDVIKLSDFGGNPNDPASYTPHGWFSNAVGKRLSLYIGLGFGYRIF